MRRLAEAANWVRQLFSRARFEREMHAEMEAHIAQEAALQQARGLMPDEALAAARRAFGNVAQLQEQARDSIGTRLVQETLSDIRYSARGLLRTPGFTLVALLSLTFGIAVNTAIFSFFRHAFAPPRVTNPATFVWLGPRITYPGWQALAAEPSLFSATVVQSMVPVAFVRPASIAMPARAMLVSNGYFAMYDGRPALGRVLLQGDGHNIGETPPVVLSYKFWRRVFNADSSVVGNVLRLTNGTAFTVVGVASEGFGGAGRRIPDFWIPLQARNLLPAERTGATMPASWTSDPDANWLSLSARLAPGTSPDQARARITTLLTHLGTADSAIVQRGSTFMHVADEGSFTGKSGGGLYVTLLATLCVLLIGCANVANLVLARGARRRREIAVRMSLGASRTRLIRQLMTESAMLAAIGGSAALLVSAALLQVVTTSDFITTSFGGELDIFDGILQPNMVVIVFTFSVAFLSAAVCGLLPALRSTKLDLSSATRDDGRAFGTRVARSRLRTALVTGQVALSLVLLITASVLVHSSRNGNDMDVGFDRERITVLAASATESGYSAAQHNEFGRLLQERLVGAFGASKVARGTIPIMGTGFVRVDPAGAQRRAAGVAAVSPAYFGVMGIPIKRGRNFTDLEARSAADVIIISEAMARRFWPAVEALGQRVTLARDAYGAGPDSLKDLREVTVVGIARDAQMAGLDDVPRSFLYEPADTGAFVVRTAPGSSPITATLRDAARTVDPNVLVTVRPMNDIVGEYTRLLGAKMTALFSGFLGALALMLSVLGIFGVVAYAVSQRTREIGVRLAIGAQRSDVLSMVIRQSMRPVVVGALLGIAGGALATRAVRNMLFGVSALDPLAYMTAATIVCTAALLACYFPARRATLVNPVQALRTD